MDSQERESAEGQLARLELLLAAQERRHEVVDLVWRASTEEEAAKQLRDLFKIADDRADPRVVLDMQVRRLTETYREAIATNVAHLRNILEAN